MKLQDSQFIMTYWYDVACSIMLARPLKPQVKKSVTSVYEDGYDLKDCV